MQKKSKGGRTVKRVFKVNRPARVKRVARRAERAEGVNVKARRPRAARVVPGAARVPGVPKSRGSIVVKDICSITVTRTVPGAFKYITPCAFPRSLLPHLRMYDRVQLLSVSVQWQNVVSTGRDGLMFIGWDFDGSSVPINFDGAMVHQNKRGVRLWEPSGTINISLPPTFRMPVDKVRATADTHGHFAPAGQQDLAIGYIHDGVDATAPVTLGYIVVTITARLMDLSPPVIGGTGSAEYFPGEAAEGAGVAALAAPASAGPIGEWIPEPAVVAEKFVRPVSTAPPAGPAMAAARSLRVSPSPSRAEQQ